jgi:hypothetical protein
MVCFECIPFQFQVHRFVISAQAIECLTMDMLCGFGHDDECTRHATKHGRLRRGVLCVGTRTRPGRGLLH